MTDLQPTGSDSPPEKPSNAHSSHHAGKYAKYAKDAKDAKPGKSGGDPSCVDAKSGGADREVVTRSTDGQATLLKWPVAFDCLGNAVVPDAAKRSELYYYDVCVDGEEIRVPLVLRASATPRRAPAANVPANENRPDAKATATAGQRRKVAPHFAIAANRATASNSALLEGLGHTTLSSWHLLWQCFARQDCREIKVCDNRADIKTPEGWIVEIQRSRISIDDVQRRNQQYRQVVWLLDAQHTSLEHTCNPNHLPDQHSETDVDLPNDLLKKDDEVASVAIGAFKASAVLASICPSRSVQPTVDSGKQCPEPAAAAQEKPQTAPIDYFDRFRFRRPPKPLSPNAQLKADEKKADAAEHNTPQKSQKAQSELFCRVYLDVGIAGHVLRVKRCERSTEHAGKFALSVVPVAIGEFLRAEYGTALEPSEAVLSTLLKQRALLLLLERAASPLPSIEEFRAEQQGAQLAAWRTKATALQTQLAIFQGRLDELEAAASEGLLLKRVARLCDRCQEPYPIVRRSADRVKATSEERLCPSCMHRAIATVEDRTHMDCYRCGTQVELKALGQEPSTGRFFCKACAHPCAKHSCRNFAYAKFKLCPDCAAIKPS